MSPPTRISPVRKTALSLIDEAAYEITDLSLSGTKFTVLTRRENGLSKKMILSALETNWPKLVQRLGANVREAALIDFDAAIGGGPMDRFVIGVYSSRNIAPSFQEVIHQTTGWNSFSTTHEYIEKYYGGFSNAYEAYVTDMVIHELGHLYFGFGVTTAPEDQNDWWFLFGLGLVYDRLLWDELYSQPSPLFEAIIQRWKNRFSSDASVDQRLVRPDLSNDETAGLCRLQTYGHGKAFCYLSELRRRMGESEFDSLIRRYLSDRSGCPLVYDDFIQSLPARFSETVERAEVDFSIR